MMTDAAYPCVQCGSPVPRNAQFCLVCGTPASSRSQTAALGATPHEPAGSPGAVSAAGGVPASAGWQPEPAVEPILPSQLLPANYGRRVVAFLLDGVAGTVLWLLIAVPLMAAGVIQVQTSGSTFSVNGLSAVLLLVPALLVPLANLLLQSFLGFSIGMLIMGLRIVNAVRFTRPGLGWMLLRNLVVGAASLVLGLGQYVVYLSPLWDSGRQGRGWHDKLARTWVIDVKAGPNPLKARPGQLLADDRATVAADLLPVPAARADAGPAPVAAASSAPIADPWAAPRPAVEPIASVPGFAPPPVVTPAELAVEEDSERTRLTDSGRSAIGTGVTVFRLDTGEIVPIIRNGALGRDPVSPGGDPSDILIAVTGDTLSVSKTHLEFGVDAGHVWVADRGSTNGSAIVREDGAEYPLDPGERITVVPGDRVRVGTRVFSVEASA
ncbi:RDD family protein [Herbiconiux sp. YIM B11900]|uniref:RDD family protein n=1 Tax=Herbiconiux sp. YIM B11900 TaxID=3404131 RepID=UPI003F83CC2A